MNGSMLSTKIKMGFVRHTRKKENGIKSSGRETGRGKEGVK